MNIIFLNQKAHSTNLSLLLFLTWTNKYEDKINIYHTELKIQVSTSNSRNI